REGQLPLAVAEEDRHVAVLVAGRDVRVGVAVEVADRDRVGTPALGRERRAGTAREAALAVAEQHRDVPAARIRGGKVGPSVAVEVSGRDRDGPARIRAE